MRTQDNARSLVRSEGERKSMMSVRDARKEGHMPGGCVHSQTCWHCGLRKSLNCLEADENRPVSPSDILGGGGGRQRPGYEGQEAGGHSAGT